MRATLDYGDSTTVPTSGAGRRLLVGISLCVLVGLTVVFGGLLLWFHYEMSQGTRIDLTLTNHSTVPADAFVIEPGTGGAAITAASVGTVGAGASGESSKLTGRMVGPAVVRVRVGERWFEGKAGYLLDDDGPHRFWVEAYDDRVEVTRRSNEAPWRLDMRPVTGSDLDAE